MSDEDDDLPVLTQVLRIGAGRAPAVPKPATIDDAFEDEHEPSLDEALLTDQLVIGNEPRPAIEPYIPLETPTSDPIASDGAPASDASNVDEPFDAGLDLDLDTSTQAAQLASSEEREALLAVEAAAADAAEGVGANRSDAENALVDASTPAAFDPAALAALVREAVMNDLSTRIDIELDARIAEALRAELEIALASLHRRLREQLADALRDVVRRAVDTEVARLREIRGESIGGQ
jgi:hypothetical protein